MTLPKDVADSLADIAGEAECRCDVAYTSRRLKDPTCNHDLAESVGIIRAHLLSQDAEIERKASELATQFIRARDWAGLSGRNERRAELAESRLATANALLRECDEVARKRGDKYGLCDAIDNDGQPYQSAHLAAHLQGAGDE